MGMISLRFVWLFPALAAAACERTERNVPPRVTPQTAAAVGEGSAAGAQSSSPGKSGGQAPSPEPRLVAEAVILDEWRKAANKDECAPLAFASTGRARGAPRPATFGGGWGVAFDLPNLRSAYGIAGPGLVAADRGSGDLQRERLQEQWPHARDLEALPQPAFAGYGVEGAQAYPAGNPTGRGVNSLAYVRVGGEQCTYNVWSRLGRTHLETLLRAMRMVPVD